MPELALRDIHLPATVSWWPPAPGWWIVLFIGLIVAVWLLYLRRRGPQARPRQDAAVALDEITQQYRGHGNAHQLLMDLSVLLRRTGITFLGRDRTAGLTGSAWYQELNALAGGDVLTARSIEILGQAPYQRDVRLDPAEVEDVIIQCRKWIAALPVKLSRESRRGGAHV